MMRAEPLGYEQGTEEWFQARLGKATASRFKDIMATIRTGEAAARRMYRAELVVERLTGNQIDRYKSKAMEWGTETEALARLEYVLKTGNNVDQCGFFQHPELQAGASPDGLVGEDGLIEIKSREVYNHIAALKDGEMPKEYMAQVQGQMWITGRAWCDFISFAPELPENAQLFVQRIQRDQAYIDDMEMMVIKFLDEVAEEIKFIEGYKK